ncbi:MAG TPA: hypothetical protein VE129_12385 [Thermoanaerobaculia bacterium]|nr:hypothetical protein [Thermoanaerobaculia bacterium]
MFLAVAAALGAILPIAGIAVLEVASLEINVRSEARAPTREGTYLEGFFVPDLRLGYGPRRFCRVSARRRLEGQNVYDVTYTTDALSRRVSPVPDPGGRSRHVLFFGCSFTFGEGVEDDETLPSQFGRQAPGYRPYNYGFCGYGPQAALARLEQPSFRAGVAEPEGLAVFVYLAGHERRVVGSMRVVTQWGASMPSYDVDGEGRLVLEGSFRSSRPLRMKLFALLAGSETLRLMGVDFPLRIGEGDYERTARILAAARNAYSRTFRGRFLVVVYPTTDRRLRILPHLRRLGVEVVDFSGLFDPEAPGLCLPEDGHPSPRALRIVARSLAQRLNVRPRNPGPRGGE